MATSDHGEARRSFRARHSLTQRLVLILNIVVVLTCFTSAGLLLAAKDLRESLTASPELNIDRTTLPTRTDPETGETIPTETFPAADPEAKNFLITGADEGGCPDPDSPYANAADPDRASDLSDTIMLVRVDPASHQAAVLSFPRDLWVSIPGRGKGKINWAYQRGNPTRLAETIYENFGIVADYSLEIDFCAFKRVVDSVGGVSVPFEFPVFDESTGLDITAAGCHRFNGDEALAYVRSRKLHYVDADGKAHLDGAGDLGRVSRQQDFLRRVLRAALDKGLFSPSVARGLLDVLQDDIVFSQDLTIDDIMSFVGVMGDVEPEGVATYQIESIGRKIGTQAAQLPQLEGDNMQAILAIFKGEAALAGAPEQVFATTTTATTDAPASGMVSASPGTTSTATTSPATTVAAPEQNTKGIVPPAGVQC